MSSPNAVYMDSCCFIDIVKFDVNAKLEDGRANEVWHLKKLLQAHRDGALVVYISTLTIAEANHVGETPVPTDVQKAFDALLMSGQYVNLVQPSPLVCSRARNLRWSKEMRLKGADSIHLASALELECVEFYSTDKAFARLHDKVEGNPKD